MTCETPIWIQGQTVPCGKCSACLTNKRNHWIIRLTEEAKESVTSFFMTITYSDENLVCDSDGVSVLCYDHLRAFHKATRKLGFKYKYFSVGEYGEKSNRPHYHMLVFSLSSNFNYDLFEKCWKYGFIQYGYLNEATIKYCTKDMLKEVDLYKDLERSVRPHIRVSHGMGISYVEKMKSFHKVYGDHHQDGLVQRNVYKSNGKTNSMPRYYADKIYSKLERGVIRALRSSDFNYDNFLLATGDKEALANEANRVKVFSQGVEQRKAKRLRIHHYGKKL